MTPSTAALAVPVAALATFLVGGPWYSAALFGGAWQREMPAANASRAHPARVFGLAYVFSLVACTALSFALGPSPTLTSGALTGLAVGACFVAASFGVNYQFAGRSFTALAIDGGYHVVQFTAFGAVLGAWPAG
jgi:hypothetical protein